MKTVLNRFTMVQKHIFTEINNVIKVQITKGVCKIELKYNFIKRLGAEPKRGRNHTKFSIGFDKDGLLLIQKADQFSVNAYTGSVQGSSHYFTIVASKIPYNIKQGLFFSEELILVV